MIEPDSAAAAIQLRHQAEDAAGNDHLIPEESLSPERMRSLLHELRVHQIELEIQNEELRRTQQELEISRSRYFDLYDLAPVGYVTVSEQGLVQEANLTVAHMLGINRGALLKQPFSAYIHPDDQDMYYLKRKLLVETGVVQSIDMRMLHVDGTTIFVHLQAAPAPHGDYRITLDNISELWRARQELVKAQKIESLGVLAGGIAHDFNNILAVIIGNISLVRLHTNIPEQVKLRLDDAQIAADRAKDLAKQLLTFARGGNPVKKVIDVRAILKEAAGFALLGSNVKCVLSLEDNLWAVEADEGQISQVIHNLVLNAVQAMPHGGTVSLRADNVLAQKSRKKYVRFSIEDTGSGIPEKNLQKIFDPYFTTKKLGSGLGLATSYSIIKNHGGKIRASSQVGTGSTFTISLPAMPEGQESTAPAQSTLYRGCGRVLVMDDEILIRELSKALLENLGYTAECVENGAQAVALYVQRNNEGTPFDAVILDLTIPGGTGGEETIQSLLEINPDVKALACSGYASNQVMAKFRDFGFKGVLCKPYRLEELSRALYELFME